MITVNHTIHTQNHLCLLHLQCSPSKDRKDDMRYGYDIALQICHVCALILICAFNVSTNITPICMCCLYLYSLAVFSYILAYAYMCVSVIVIVNSYVSTSANDDNNFTLDYCLLHVIHYIILIFKEIFTFSLLCLCSLLAGYLLIYIVISLSLNIQMDLNGNGYNCCYFKRKQSRQCAKMRIIRMHFFILPSS